MATAASAEVSSYRVGPVANMAVSNMEYYRYHAPVMRSAASAVSPSSAVAPACRQNDGAGSIRKMRMSSPSTVHTTSQPAPVLAATVLAHVVGVVRN